MPYTIYVLKDPVTGKVRYVGATGSTLSVRLGDHIRRAVSGGSNSPKDKWVRSLMNRDEEPLIEEIETLGNDPVEAGIAEDNWIAHLRSRDCDLLNVREGGVGLFERGSRQQVPFPVLLNDLEKRYERYLYAVRVKEKVIRVLGRLRAGGFLSNADVAAGVYNGLADAAEESKVKIGKWPERAFLIGMLDEIVADLRRGELA